MTATTEIVLDPAKSIIVNTEPSREDTRVRVELSTVCRVMSERRYVLDQQFGSYRCEDTPEQSPWNGTVGRPT